MDHSLFTGMLENLWRKDVAMLLGIIFVIMLLKLVPGRRRRKGRAARSVWRPSRDMTDPAAQMNAVALAGFQRRAVMNKTEYRVFHAIEQLLRSHGGGYRLMAQTSLGEVLAPQVKNDPELQRQALASINSKRLDLAIFDRAGMLTLAIEVQGKGHFQHSKTFMRDAVKREALRRAGVDMLEVASDFRNDDLARTVLAYLAASPEKRAG